MIGKENGKTCKRFKTIFECLSVVQLLLNKHFDKLHLQNKYQKLLLTDKTLYSKRFNLHVNEQPAVSFHDSWGKSKCTLRVCLFDDPCNNIVDQTVWEISNLLGGVLETALNTQQFNNDS